MKQKRGQFFLIAAVVIIVVVVSVVTISNYTQRKDTVKLYDLGQELGIESQNVLDYGTYSELNETELKVLMESFIVNYVDYIEEKKNVYFIFGNKDKVNVIGYQEINPEEVYIDIGEGKYLLSPEEMGKTVEFPAGDKDINKVVVTIEGMVFQFSLKPGENFYFIIWQEVGGEKHVVTSDTE